MAVRKVTVVVDTREQRPLLFPRIATINRTGRIIEVVKEKLDFGDYALKGAPGECCIERKGSIGEIAQNMLSDDLGRQTRSFDKLAGAKHPILLIEQTLSDLQRASRYVPCPADAIDKLLTLLNERNISLWLVGNCTDPTRRRLLGEMVARALVTWVEKKLVRPPVLTLTL